MKKLLLLSVFFASTFFSYGQITLGSSDFPFANFIYRISTATSFAGMDTLGGANHTWDYSPLANTRTGQRVDTILDESNTNSLYALYFADVSFNANRSNQATKGNNFNLGGQIAITDVYNFFYNSSSSYKQTGFGASINGIPAPTAYSPHDFIYRFPMQYGNVDTSYSGYTVSLPGVLYYGVSKRRINQADGWGTLTTPYGTFNVLRVKSSITERDTVHIDSLGFGYGFNVPAVTEYKWLGQGQGVPLLKITKNGNVISQIEFRDTTLTTTLSEIEPGLSGFEIYPNPSSRLLNLSLTSVSYDAADFRLLDQQGRIVYTTSISLQQGLNKQVIVLPATVTSGNYFVMLAGKGKTLIKPVIIE